MNKEQTRVDPFWRNGGAETTIKKVNIILSHLLLQVSLQFGPQTNRSTIGIPVSVADTLTFSPLSRTLTQQPNSVS